MTVRMHHDAIGYWSGEVEDAPWLEQPFDLTEKHVKCEALLVDDEVFHSLETRDHVTRVVAHGNATVSDVGPETHCWSSVLIVAHTLCELEVDVQTHVQCVEPHAGYRNSSRMHGATADVEED
jgi:hypothetical protein